MKLVDQKYVYVCLYVCSLPQQPRHRNKSPSTNEWIENMMYLCSKVLSLLNKQKDLGLGEKWLKRLVYKHGIWSFSFQKPCKDEQDSSPVIPITNSRIRIHRASQLWLARSTSSGCAWEILPQWIRGKNSWGWSLTLTSRFHVNKHPCACTPYMCTHTHNETHMCNRCNTIHIQNWKKKGGKKRKSLSFIVTQYYAKYNKSDNYTHNVG